MDGWIEGGADGTEGWRELGSEGLSTTVALIYKTTSDGNDTVYRAQ